MHYTAASSPRLAFNRMLSDLAVNTPVDQMQILSIVSTFDELFYRYQCILIMRYSSILDLFLHRRT
jgi:hypothetical protein